MMNSLREFFTSGNLLYKLIALVLAVLLWLTVTEPFS